MSGKCQQFTQQPTKTEALLTAVLACMTTEHTPHLLAVPPGGERTATEAAAYIITGLVRAQALHGRYSRGMNEHGTLAHTLLLVTSLVQGLAYDLPPGRLCK